MTSSGGATVGATTYGKKGVPTALEPTAFDEELLPTPAAVKGRGYEEPVVECKDICVVQ